MDIDGNSRHGRLDGRPGEWVCNFLGANYWQLLTKEGDVTGWVSSNAGVFSCGYIPTIGSVGDRIRHSSKVLHIDVNDLESAKKWVEGYVTRARNNSVVSILEGNGGERRGPF